LISGYPIFGLRTPRTAASHQYFIDFDNLPGPDHFLRQSTNTAMALGGPGYAGTTAMNDKVVTHLFEDGSG
jgi:hypothetical protein